MNHMNNTKTGQDTNDHRSVAVVSPDHIHTRIYFHESIMHHNHDNDHVCHKKNIKNKDFVSHKRLKNHIFFLSHRNM